MEEYSDLSVESSLALRPGESIRFYEDAPEKYRYLYIVCLCSVPEFPDDVYKTCRGFAVCCARWQRWAMDKEPTFGWVHLDQSTKEAIGEDLEQMNVDTDRWYYMTVSPAEEEEYKPVTNE